LQSAEQVNYSSVTFAFKSILGFERTSYVEINASMCRILFIILTFLFSNNLFANNKITKTTVVDNEWQANFESKSLVRWSYILHPQGISLLPPPNEPSNISAYIEIKGDADYLWRGREDLNRVELQYKPINTIDGSTTEVSWRFMLPELFSDDTHQIAYWESDSSYQQSFRLQLNGEDLSLVSSANNKELWRISNIKAQHWYSINLSITWSITQGSVDLAVDGEPQGRFVMPTLIAEDESMFFQLGILRHQSSRVEAIWLDDIIVRNIPAH